MGTFSKRDPTIIGEFTVINIIKRTQRQDKTSKCKNPDQQIIQGT